MISEYVEGILTREGTTWRLPNGHKIKTFFYRGQTDVFPGATEVSLSARRSGDSGTDNDVASPGYTITLQTRETSPLGSMHGWTDHRYRMEIGLPPASSDDIGETGVRIYESDETRELFYHGKHWVKVGLMDRFTILRGGMAKTPWKRMGGSDAEEIERNVARILMEINTENLRISNVLARHALTGWVDMSDPELRVQNGLHSRTIIPADQAIELVDRPDGISRELITPITKNPDDLR
jgi:hypothetical protein